MFENNTFSAVLVQDHQPSENWHFTPILQPAGSWNAQDSG